MATFTRTTTTPAASGIKRLIAAHPLTTYFVLAYGLMWLFVVPLGLSRSHGSSLLPYDLSEGLGNALYLLGTLIGPTVAALIVTGVLEGRTGVARLLKRVIQWRVLFRRNGSSGNHALRRHCRRLYDWCPIANEHP